MDGKVILIVGRKGSGKTTDIKGLIKNVHPDALLLHDVSAQYTDIYKKPRLDFAEFTAKAMQVKECVIVFEEATIFISHYRNGNILDFLVSARHEKNTIIFAFHSLQDLPKWILRLSDYLILHKTQDTEKYVTNTFPEFFTTWKDVLKHEKTYHSVMLKL